MAEFWQTLARAIDGERRRRRLTTKALAELAGVDVSTVRRLLGAHPVRLSSLRLVAAGLDIDWTGLVANVGEPSHRHASGSHR